MVVLNQSREGIQLWLCHALAPCIPWSTILMIFTSLSIIAYTWWPKSDSIWYIHLAISFVPRYDHECAGGSKAVKDDPAAASKAGKKSAAEGDDMGDKETYYDAIKKDMGGRVARTKAAMDALDPALRVAMEGYRTGTYLRMRFTGVYLLQLDNLYVKWVVILFNSVTNNIAPQQQP